MTSNTPEPEVRACGCRTEAVIDPMSNADVIDAFVSALIGSHIDPDAAERSRLELNSQAIRTELLRRMADQQHSGRGPATGGTL